MSQDGSDSEVFEKSKPRTKSFVLIIEDPSQKQKLFGKRAVGCQAGVKVGNIQNHKKSEMEMYDMEKDELDLKENFFQRGGVDSGLEGKCADENGEKGQDQDLTDTKNVTYNCGKNIADGDVSQDFILLGSTIRNLYSENRSDGFLSSNAIVQVNDDQKRHGTRVGTHIGRNGSQEYDLGKSVTEERTKFFNLPQNTNQIQNFADEQILENLQTKMNFNRSLKLQNQNSHVENSDLNNLNKMRIINDQSTKMEFVFCKKQSVTDIQISSRPEDILVNNGHAMFESDFDSLSVINSGAVTLQNTGFEHLSNPFLGLSEKQTIGANYPSLSQDLKSKSTGLGRDGTMNLEQLVNRSIGNCQFSIEPESEISIEILSSERQSTEIVAETKRRF